jgi:hypothetical protein
VTLGVKSMTARKDEQLSIGAGRNEYFLIVSSLNMHDVVIENINKFKQQLK